MGWGDEINRPTIEGLILFIIKEYLGVIMSDKIFKISQGITRVNFEGVMLLGFVDKCYGTFHSEAIDTCTDQSLYILILLDLFYGNELR